MYLKSKAAGVQINKMYIPKYLVGFTARIINFVLETPFIDTGKAEFIIEKGAKDMTNFTNEEIKANEKFLNETISDEALKTDNSKNDPAEIPTEILRNVALLSLMFKVRDINAFMKDVDNRLKALENHQCKSPSDCNCCANKDEKAA